MSLLTANMFAAMTDVMRRPTEQYIIDIDMGEIATGVGGLRVTIFNDTAGGRFVRNIMVEIKIFFNRITDISAFFGKMREPGGLAGGGISARHERTMFAEHLAATCGIKTQHRTFAGASA